MDITHSFRFLIRQDLPQYTAAMAAVDSMVGQDEMSYDVQVWSVDRPDVTSSLPSSASWKKHRDHWSLEKRQWQIICGPPDVVLPEDIPEEVSASMPGIAFLTELVLEPISAPESAKKVLLRAAGAVAKASHGVVYDSQTDELTTPKGVMKRFVPEARSERFALLELGWWFLSDSIFAREGMDGLLDIFAALLPEALPRRYGLYEPPQHLLADEGREHLSAFLLEHLNDSPVLYPNRPVLGLSFACTRERQHPRLGFRCNRVAVECEASVINQPGWQEGLRRFWLTVCEHLNPFFADVRTLNGYLRMGATYGSDIETEVHPIRSWFWRGVPRELGHAVAIGAPYVDLWPRAHTEGQFHGDLIVLDVGAWTEGNNLTLEAPDGIRQAWTPKYKNDGMGWSVGWVTTYPGLWPFGTL